MKKILITAGPTREKIDPVRFISNRSSGRMGYAIAQAAAQRGCEVVLISGPVELAAPGQVRLVKVESAAEMFDAVAAEFPDCDCLIMAAAVADYRPAKPSDVKIKKAPGKLYLELERTVDILAEMGRRKRSDQLLVGFAAETENLLDYAAKKLQSKNLDFIAANYVSDGFGTSENTIHLLDKELHDLVIGPAGKDEVARLLLEKLLG